jgi:hypothetical protein
MAGLMKNPFDSPFFGRDKYFITFINDFVHYSYIYLLHTRIMVVKSDSDGEYYGSCDGSGQCLPHLLNSLKNMAFCTQYAMPGTSQHNEVARWHNCTLMDMANNFSLPIHFGWKPLRSLYIY